MAEYILYGVEEDNSKFIFKSGKSLEDIDKFTSIFYSAEDAKEVLNELYGTNVKLKSMLLMKKDKLKEGTIPIRFRDDMYDELSVIETYKNYLWANPNLIKDSNVKHVNLDFMRDFKKTGKINFSEREFNIAIKAYFYRNGELVYTKVREAYFELLEMGQKVKCKKM